MANEAPKNMRAVLVNSLSFKQLVPVLFILVSSPTAGNEAELFSTKASAGARDPPGAKLEITEPPRDPNLHNPIKTALLSARAKQTEGERQHCC